MARQAFGGVKIDFSRVTAYELKDVFGFKPLTSAEMIKKLWAFIKKHNLQVK